MGNQEPPPDLIRRKLMQSAAVTGLLAGLSPKEARAIFNAAGEQLEERKRFPYFKAQPVSYLNVKLNDNLLAPRQQTIRDVSLAWMTRYLDKNGGLEGYRADPQSYRAGTRIGELEAMRSLESMATILGLSRDPAIEGLFSAWAKVVIDGQAADGYLQDHFGTTLDHPPQRWIPFSESHESNYIGRYIQGAIAYREVTGNSVVFESAVRAADNMVNALLDKGHPYASGHPEIEQALMRLYGYTGDTKYLRLVGWYLAQHGHHDGRPPAGKKDQDHLPLAEQRTIEGHAVEAAFLFNGVTQYVGATGDAAYRETVLAVWEDLVNRKMYLQGASGQTSSTIEGYKSEPYSLDPADTYGESCASFGNFRWAHSLFALTGEAQYLDVAERILYNALYASLALKGDRFFYWNVSETQDALVRFSWHPVPCCPPNILILFASVGGYFYSLNETGIFVKHYGASEAQLPFGPGVRVKQSGNYPWDGRILIDVEPQRAIHFDLRLRLPDWARTHQVSVNGKRIPITAQNGWLILSRRWQVGDRVELDLPMTPERVTMPAEFKAFKDRAALRRGPVIYCLEQQDSFVSSWELSLPENVELIDEYRPDLLGGVTVIKAKLPRATIWTADRDPVDVMFVPYGVWDNRDPGPMYIWLAAKPRAVDEWFREFRSKPATI